MKHKCEICGNEFQHRFNSANRCCSRACGFELRGREQRASAKKYLCNMPPAPKTCAVCGSLFISIIPKAKYCSRDCKTRAAMKAKHPEYYSTRTCIVCGKLFNKDYGRNTARNACSEECNMIHKQNQSKRFRRIAKGKRKALTRGARAESVDPIAVFNRDGWKCQICGCKTPQRFRGTYRGNAPELDHIVPLSRGGAHTYLNTQCACRKCNGEKSNTVYGQTLLAI